MFSTDLLTYTQMLLM